MLDKIVVITGASSGIGRALAEKYASEGAKVVVAARRVGRLAELVKEFGTENILAVETDVTLEADCQHLIERAVERFGRIDILINNAGVSMRAAFLQCDLSVLKRLMEVNFWGAVYCTRYALPYLLERKGSVVGVASIAGYLGLPGRTGYSASKFAMRGFLDAIRTEYLKTGLHVMVVAPGFVASEVREQALVANGNAQGESPRNEKHMMSAERCAELIYRGINRRKRTLVLSFVEGRLAVFLSKWLPTIVDRLNYNMMKKEPDSPF